MTAWLARQILPIQIVLAMLAIALLAGVVILAILGIRKFIRLGREKDLEAKDRVGLQIEVVKTAAQILGGAFFLVTIYVAWQNLVVSQEKYKTDLFTRAIEQLGSNKLEVRLGGIYALERIARESEKDHGPIMEVLTAYVREKAPWTPAKAAEAQKQPAPSGMPASGLKQPETKPAPEIKPATDIQAILTVIGRRSRTYGKGEIQPLDLRQTDLRGADLYKAQLERANLSEAHLERANLSGAQLVRANLWEAYLRGARLSYTHLEGAYLYRSHLDGADLRDAYLEGADLAFAHLQRAKLGDAHLQKADLEGAHLQKAALGGVNLQRAYLYRAHLERAYLWGGHLEDANLSQANLEGANLYNARLERANLGGANLKGADLRGANLMDAKGVTREQIDSAIIDEYTRLPEYLKKTVPNKTKPQ